MSLKLFVVPAILIVSGFAVHAQDNAATIKEKDSTILANTIMPALQAAQADQAEPDWKELSSDIKTNYGDYYAERMVIKAKIYFYYGTNWPEFTKAIVQFTEKYEDKDDLKLMNTNANFILKYSNDKTELETAAQWSRHTIDKEPSNETYQATYKALQEKLQ